MGIFKKIIYGILGNIIDGIPLETLGGAPEAID